MSFEWNHYLELAYDLATSDNANINQEAALRCAISRAYYSVFCKSRNYLRDVDGVSDRYFLASHKSIIDRYRNDKNKMRRKIGENLLRLRNIRNTADYEDTFSDVEKRTDFALKLAESIFSDIKNL